MAHDITEQFVRDYVAARDQSLEALRAASDHRRIELLAGQIHASLDGESRADSLLAITTVLADWLSTEPPEQQTLICGIIGYLLTRAMERD